MFSFCGTLQNIPKNHSMEIVVKEASAYFLLQEFQIQLFLNIIFLLLWTIIFFKSDIVFRPFFIYVFVFITPSRRFKIWSSWITNRITTSDLKNSIFTMRDGTFIRIKTLCRLSFLKVINQLLVHCSKWRRSCWLTSPEKEEPYSVLIHSHVT